MMRRSIRFSRSGAANHIPDFKRSVVYVLDAWALYHGYL